MDGIVFVYNIILYEIIWILLYRLVFGKEVKLLINVLIENENFIIFEKEVNKVVYVCDLEEKFFIIYE